jgi:hypothetical protein
MKEKNEAPTGVQDICRKLKLQLEELAATIERQLPRAREDQSRRNELMEQLKAQLAELSR